MSSLTLPSSRYSIFISSVRLSWNSSCKIATFPLWLFSLPYSILFPSIALATTWHMPVSHTKRVGQVGTLFSSLFHLKYPKQCLVNSMKATVLAAKRILLHLPNAVNSFFFFFRHFNQNNRKLSGRLQFYISDGCSLANWLPHFYNPWLPSFLGPPFLYLPAWI